MWAMVFVVALAMASAVLVGWSTFKGLEAGNAAKVILTRVGIDLLSPEMVEVKAGAFTMGGPMGDGASHGRWVHDENIERDRPDGRHGNQYEQTGAGCVLPCTRIDTHGF